MNSDHSKELDAVGERPSRPQECPNPQKARKTWKHEFGREFLRPRTGNATRIWRSGSGPRSWFFYCPTGTKESSPPILWVGLRLSKISSPDRDERITISALVSNVSIGQTRKLVSRPCGTNGSVCFHPSTTNAGLFSIVPAGQGKLKFPLNRRRSHPHEPN
jgi:hypothetical protein